MCVFISKVCCIALQVFHLSENGIRKLRCDYSSVICANFHLSENCCVVFALYLKYIPGTEPFFMSVNGIFIR
jgi:hypothetical protein